MEHVEAALSLVSKGVDDTIAARAVLSGPSAPTQLHLAEMYPPLHDTIAFIRRNGVALWAATREIADMAHAMLRQDLRLTW